MKEFGRKMTKKHDQTGFTLIEMALVIVIAGILLSFLGAALINFVKKNRIDTTEFRIVKIEEALARYLRVNGYYPCPASRFDGPTQTTFARSAITDCTGGVATGTVNIGGADGVRIGAVPTRNLNLPDEFVMDGWGKKFTYAVSKRLATNLQYTADGGRISIVDGNNQTVVTPAGSAHYIVLSHGETGDGGYQLGQGTLPVTPCAPSSLDRENCNDDATFRITLVNSEANIADFYDDYASFKGQTAQVLEPIPTGAVMAFNLDSCPTGWTAYTQAQGRFMARARPTAQTMDQYAVVLATPPQFASVNFTNRNIDNGDAQAIIPPFVALLYCERL